MDENLVFDVCFCGKEGEDVQTWVLCAKDLMYELCIFYDDEMASFMYQNLQDDARQFYNRLPEDVQYSWKLLKYTLLKHYAQMEMAPKNSVYFCGTANECISSWITQVGSAMTKLAIEDDAARAVYASQGLSHDAFVFLHMLREDWRYSWLALKFSLLMRYQKWLVPEGSKEACFVKTFQLLQDEFWDALQSQFQFEFDASAHMVHEENTPMIDVYKVYVSQLLLATCILQMKFQRVAMLLILMIIAIFYQMLRMIFWMDLYSMEPLLYENSLMINLWCFINVLEKALRPIPLLVGFVCERDASNDCDRDEGVCTEDLMVSDTFDIANSENNGSVHMLPLARTNCDKKNSLVDKAFAACGEAMLPNGYLLDTNIVESLKAIDEKSVDINQLEAVEPLDEQVLDDELEEDTWGLVMTTLDEVPLLEHVVQMNVVQDKGIDMDQEKLHALEIEDYDVSCT
ncbi:hypothetical protein L7F22_031600 [Adiantum nelumboides]|nr:hypothetical protein [Adiantum nelumboides]